MAAKLIVSLPAGWDNKLIMDGKDFATLCDIFERSVGFSNEYRDGKYYRVLKDLLLEGGTFIGDKPITTNEFEQLTKPATEEA